MKKLLFPFLLLLAGKCFAVTYYVDSDGGLDSNPGLSEDRAWKTMAKVNGAAFRAGDVILLKRGCVWNEQLTASSSGTVSQPIVYGVYGSSGEAVITGGQAASLHTNGRSGLRFERLCFRGKQVYVAGSGAVTLAGCIIRNSDDRGVYVVDSPGVSVLNCTITGNHGDGVYASGVTCTVTVRNTLIFGNGMDYYSGLNAVNGGRIAYDHCLISGNGYSPGYNLPASTGLTDAGGNQAGVLPGITRYSHPEGCFVITSDDYDVNYWKQLDAALSPLGVRLTLFLAEAYLPVSGKTDLLALARAGHEIGIHSWSHSNLVADTLFTISTSNSSPAVTLDAAAKEIRLTCGNPSNNVTLSWASESKSVMDLRTAAAGKGWTIEPGPNVSERVQLSSALDSGGPRTGFPYVAHPDVRAPYYPYWRNEVVAARDWARNELGVEPSSLAYPYGQLNADLRTWLRDVAGIQGIGARTVLPTGNLLSSIDVFRCPGMAASLFKGDGSERAIREAARNAFIHAVQDGSIYVIYVHNAAEMSPQQMTWFVDEIKRAGGTFKTFGQAIRDIRAAPAVTVDGYVYTRTWPDQGDFHLLPGSACADAGAAAPVAFDYDGKPVPLGGGYDIGALEYGAPPSGFTITSGVSDPNGAISPLGRVTVPRGGSREYAITPAPGYTVNDVLVDGKSAGAVTRYVFSDVRADHTITASFRAVTTGFIITATAGENGDISPKGSVPVNAGGSCTFTISPCPGYVVNDVLVDGKPVGAVTRYTFSDVRADHAITVSFRAVTACFVITATAGENGNISPRGKVAVAEGADCTFTITPCPGYMVKDVLVDGKSVGAVACHTFTGVKGNHTISAFFKAARPCVIVADAGPHGDISPSGTVKVPCGTDQSFTITPKKGYRVCVVLVDYRPAGAKECYTFRDVREDHTISVVFAPVCERDKKEKDDKDKDRDGDVADKEKDRGDDGASRDHGEKNGGKKDSRKVSLDGYPNPFNPATTIRFTLPADDRVQLTVYSISGQKVRDLLDDTRGAGVHTILWNGRDDSGRTVSSGVYFARLQTADAVLSWRMVFMK